MTDHTLSMKLAFERFRVDYQRLFSTLHDLDEPLKSQAMEPSDMVDVGFFAREIANLADDLRKEARARTELAGKLLALRAIEENVPTYRGDYATGTPDGGLKPHVPRPGEPAYAQLCEYLGITDTHNGLVRFHWKTLKELMEKAANEGTTFPVDIDSTPEFKTVFRRKN